MKKIIILIFLASATVSCKKLVEVGTPQNELTTDKVFTDTTSALAALGNIYAQLDHNIDFNFSVLSDAYTDNLNYTGSSNQTLAFYQSNLTPSNSINLNIWEYFYSIIYDCNDLIAQLPISGKLPVASIKQFSNEARFLRSYAYFYLVNIYGNVPLLLTTNATANAATSRSSSQLVYEQIVSDLVAAKQGLSLSYQGGGKVRANSLAASALLARVYLFEGNWVAAETEASNVIESGKYSLSENLNNVFLANSDEAILQIWNQYGYTSTSTAFVPSANTLPEFPASAYLLNSFERGDRRLSIWIDTNQVSNGTSVIPYPYYGKYKSTASNSSSSEYLMVLRLAEQYLIRAEARAEQGKISGSGSALEDINVIRSRAGLVNTIATTPSALLAAIAQERRVELFGEWGTRFLDLRRSGQINSVMLSEKATWKTAGDLYPIPSNELTYDHNLVQNPGY